LSDSKIFYNTELRAASLRQLSFLFGHVCRTGSSQDHYRVLLASSLGLPKDWKSKPGRPRQAWLPWSYY